MAGIAGWLGTGIQGLAEQVTSDVSYPHYPGYPNYPNYPN